MTTTYEDFLKRKSQLGGDHGFAPEYLPPFLYEFQKSLVEWAVRKGRAAMFADCGLGKTPMQLTWAQNVVQRTSGRVLIATPLAVSSQTVQEAQKFGIDCERSPDGSGNCPITVTNYERLHHFNPADFQGVVCDESSVIKNFEGKRQAIVTQFMQKVPYRLLCTATAAPNDFIELGTSSEALGELGRMDMLSQFFRNDENSLHPIWWGARWRFKAHAEQAFWRWVCSWARAVRKPSDLGFDDGNFVLPPLETREIVVENREPFAGTLFPVPAVTLKEQLEERRNTINERCESVASLVETGKPAVVWCHLNDEADLVERLVPDAVQVKGSDTDEAKEAKLRDFAEGNVRVMVTKPKIAGFGLNWQHCAHMTFFPSHSFEQYYQGVRRCWRFGQDKPVRVDIVTTEGELGVMKNLQRKAEAAEQMFGELVSHMNNAVRIDRSVRRALREELPAWL